MDMDPKEFPPRRLRGMTPDQLREYAWTHVYLSPRGGIGEIDSIPFAKITTTREMHDGGLHGLPKEDTEYAWVIYEGKEPMTVDREGRLAVPYLVLGFDLDRGDVRYTVVSPEGTGLGKLVGDPSLPPPVPVPPQWEMPRGGAPPRGAAEAMMSPEPDQFLARFVFERFFASGDDTFPAEVILAVDGLLISGRPISATRFFDQMGAGLREAAGDSELEDIGRQLQELIPPRIPGKVCTGLLSPWDLNRIRERASDHWHLENVTILGAGPQPIRVEFWRGRLADISGWTFGTLAQPAPGDSDASSRGT